VEVAALKLRYENHVAAISSELKDVQAQVLRFKHERNTYKHLLENAQKAVSEVRNSTSNKENTSHDEVRLTLGSKKIYQPLLYTFTHLFSVCG